MKQYISALEQNENIDVEWIVECWKGENSSVTQRDISYMFFGAMMIIKPNDKISADSILELGFLNDISYRLEQMK